MLTFTDEHTWEVSLYFLAAKSDVFVAYKQFEVARVRASMLETTLPKFLWAEALQYTAWMKNRTPTRTLSNKTPHEMATGMKPDLRRAHVGNPSFCAGTGEGEA